MTSTLKGLTLAVALVAAPAWAGPLKSKTKFDASSDKAFIIVEAPHPRKANKPEKTEPTDYGFLGADLETGMLEKTGFVVMHENPILLPGQDRKHDDPLVYVVERKAKPGFKAHSANYTYQGVRQWVHCRELGTYVFDFAPGTVSVISTVPGTYVADGEGYGFAEGRREAILDAVAERLAGFPNVTADVVAPVPQAVVSYTNDFDKHNGFGRKCPGSFKDGFTVESPGSEAAQVAAGLLPSAEPS